MKDFAYFCTIIALGLLIKTKSCTTLEIVDELEKCMAEEHDTQETKECIFPFTYAEKEFIACTNYVNIYYEDKNWCATEVNELNETLVNWGICTSRNCPMQCGVQLDSEYPGWPCIFPFRYDGFEFNQCTRYSSSYYWCAVEVNEPTKEATKWGACNKYCKLAGKSQSFIPIF